VSIADRATVQPRFTRRAMPAVFSNSANVYSRGRRIVAAQRKNRVVIIVKTRTVHNNNCLHLRTALT
jgi:hypothetical protein